MTFQSPVSPGAVPERVLMACDAARITAFGTGNDAQAVVLVIGSRNPNAPGADAFAAKMARSFGQNGKLPVIVVEDLDWTWLSAPGLRARIVSAVSDYLQAAGEPRLFAYGTSAGGTNVLDLARSLPMEALLAVSPQIDLGPAFRSFDPRQRQWMGWVAEDAELPDPASAFATGTHIVLMHGLRGPDAAHAVMVPRTDRVQHYVFPDMDHQLSSRLATDGRLARMFAALCKGDRAAVAVHAHQAGAIQPGGPHQITPDPSWAACPTGGEPKAILREGHDRPAF